MKGVDARCMNRNYPAVRKWFLLSLVSMITLIRYVLNSCFVLAAIQVQWLISQSPLSSSIFAPAVGNAADEFDVTDSILISLGVSAYLFGYGVSIDICLCAGISIYLIIDSLARYFYRHLAKSTDVE
jgi:hypothetical protein